MRATVSKIRLSLEVTDAKQRHFAAGRQFTLRGPHTMDAARLNGPLYTNDIISVR